MRQHARSLVRTRCAATNITEEEFVKPEHTARLAELIPGAELVLMPGTGHFAPFAQPAEFNRIVLDFLRT